MKNDSKLGLALVDMYAKCGALTKAQQVLKEFCAQDVISWNVLIGGCVQLGEGEQALNFFEEMQHEGLSPDAVTFICILKACGSIGAADKGEEIYDKVAKQGLLVNDIVLGTALVDMYAKFGATSKAQRVLEELPIRDVISWNALIAGFVQEGEVEQALNCFEELQCDGLTPDSGTLSSVLCTCNCLSLVEDAQTYFVTLSAKFGMKPDLEHYTCMVDLLGRAGHLDKAVGLIEKISSCDSGVWSSLLGACQKWGDVTGGRWTFENAVQVDKSNGAVYALMAYVYAAAGMKEEPRSIEAMRIESKAWKIAAQSWSIGRGEDLCFFSAGHAREGNKVHSKLKDLPQMLLTEKYSTSCQWGNIFADANWANP